MTAVTVSSDSFAGSTQRAQVRMTPRKATLVTFAGYWYGHTRGLVITVGGLAQESISDGCCRPVIDLQFGLSHPRGTPRDATALATVTAVRVLDKGALLKAYPAPRVGEVRLLRLKNGVITEPLTGTNYCAPHRNVCGA